MKKWVLILLMAVYTSLVQAKFEVPQGWAALKPVLVSRVNQHSPKMKLTEQEAESFSGFLTQLKDPTPDLHVLQKTLPKTTLELLRSVSERGVKLDEAEKMAAYLQSLIDKFKFQNMAVFDENTSHLIGRDWSEIDYSGEGMTWEKQRSIYLPHGVSDFKSADCLKKFFDVESKLPYFRKVYRPG
jgi:hypothetical protein